MRTHDVLVWAAGVVAAAAIAHVAAGSSAIAVDRSDPPADRPADRRELAPIEATPRPEPGGLTDLGSPASEPVPIPVVTPSPPGPVPMPLVAPTKPGPVPMPHAQLSPPDATLLPVPPRR